MVIFNDRISNYKLLLQPGLKHPLGAQQSDVPVSSYQNVFNIFKGLLRMASLHLLQNNTCCIVFMRVGVGNSE